MDNDETFAKMLMEKHILKSYRAVIYLVIPNKVTRANHVRMALVADLAQCEEVVKRLKAIL